MSEQDSQNEDLIPSREELMGETIESGESEEDLSEYSEVEQQAMEIGWNPDQEQVGDKWVSAEIFLAREPVFAEVRKLKKALGNRNKEMDAMKTHLEMMRKKENKDRIDALKAKRREAMEMGQFEEADQYEEEIDNVKEEDRRLDQDIKESTNVNPAFTEWLEDNSWYAEDEELREFADLIGPGVFSTAHPDTDPAELYEVITKKVKCMYPDTFGRPSAKPKPPAVETSRATTRTRQAKPKHTMSDVPKEDRDLAMTLIRAGHISEEEYLKDYFS